MTESVVEAQWTWLAQVDEAVGCEGNGRRVADRVKRCCQGLTDMRERSPNYVQTPRLFLRHVGRVEFADLARLEASQVQRFVLTESGRRSVASTKTLVTGLCSLLRFFHVVGFTATPLVGAVPTVSGWTGTWLPHAVDASTVKRLLASCDRGSAQGCCDDAVLVVLSRLGRPQPAATSA